MSDAGEQPISAGEPQGGTTGGLPSDSHERLVAAGLVRPGPTPRPIAELKLKPLGIDSSRAVRAILQDREES